MPRLLALTAEKPLHWIGSAKRDYLAFPGEVQSDMGYALTGDRMKKIPITRGTTNVFADLALPDAVERQTKTRLAFAINELLDKRKLKQREAAELLGIPQPKVSVIRNYRLDNISVERLMEFLMALDQDVEIRIRPRAAKGKGGRISVLAAT